MRDNLFLSEKSLNAIMEGIIMATIVKSGTININTYLAWSAVKQLN